MPLDVSIVSWRRAHPSDEISRVTRVGDARMGGGVPKRVEVDHYAEGRERDIRRLVDDRDMWRALGRHELAAKAAEALARLLDAKEPPKGTMDAYDAAMRRAGRPDRDLARERRHTEAQRRYRRRKRAADGR
jgi:hypothetical protein